MTRGKRANRALRRIGRAVVGDRLGLVLWVSLVVVYAAIWRLDLAITDTNVVANMLLAMADGSLAVTELRFPLDSLGADRVQQGLRLLDGAYYGRNYGQVAVAVPVVWALEALTAVVDARVLLAAGWSGLVLVLGRQVGILLDRPDAGRVAGAAVATVAFLASLAVATDLDVRLLPVLALQLVNLLAAAGLGLVTYRLIGLFHGRRVGLAAGIATGLATPVAFWATFPKRHVLVSLLLLIGVFSFAASRHRTQGRRWLRGGAYAAMGLIAWIHAFEGFVLVVALGGVDFATAGLGDRRALVIVTVCLVLALAPTLVTNAAVTGDPLTPPRLVGGSGDIAEDLTAEGRVPAGGEASAERSPDSSGPDGPAAESPSGGGGSPADTGGAIGAVTGMVLGLVPAPMQRAMGIVIGIVGDGLGTLSDPERLRHTFVRSGNIEGVTWTSPGYQPIELSVLESMPLLGGLLAVPVIAIQRLRGAIDRGWRSTLAGPSAVGQTDLLVATLAVTVTVVYLSRLPLHSQLTVRYLFPLYPLGIYGLARIAVVRETLGERATVGAAIAGLLVGTVGAILAFAAIDPARAEAVQATASVHLALATLLGLAVAGRSFVGEGRGTRVLGATLGGVAGVTAGYYVLAAVEYFTDGSYALDLTAVLAEIVTIVG